MAMRLVDDERELSVPLELDGAYIEAIAAQLQRAETSGSSAFAKRFSTILQDIIGQALDSDIKPPTETQLKFALDIARELGVAIPGEALRYRGSMTTFIARFEPTFSERRRRLRV